MVRMTSLPLVQCCAPLAEPALTDAEAKRARDRLQGARRPPPREDPQPPPRGDGDAVCVCDFETMLDLKQSTVSYHLKQLLDAGIVEREKRGSYAYFSLAPGALEHVCGLLGYADADRHGRLGAVVLTAASSIDNH